MTQEEALTIMKGDNNVFLTGEPGSGKSYTVDRYVDWAFANGVYPVITATTGIAATNVNGSTLHSWAGLRDDKILTDQDLLALMGNKWVRNRVRNTKVLVIDEISMASAQLMDQINRLTKVIRKDDRPFGGIKVIMVGDFFQLPPVNGAFAFESDAWQELDPHMCELTEQHRQSEGLFIEILRKARRNESFTDEEKEALKARKYDDVSKLPVQLRLETHNKDVDKVNFARLQRHPGTAKTYTMKKFGPAAEHLVRNCLSPEKLTLKEGVPVMFTKNDPELRWVNGTQGTVKEMKDDRVVVELVDGSEVEVLRAQWKRSSGYGAEEQVSAELSQIPLRLAWAITVHKSQGMTLDQAVMDLTNVFAPGQGYVAVSRVRSLAGVYFQGKLTPRAFMVDPKVIAFYQGLNQGKLL